MSDDIKENWAKVGYARRSKTGGSLNITFNPEDIDITKVMDNGKVLLTISDEYLRQALEAEPGSDGAWTGVSQFVGDFSN